MQIPDMQGKICLVTGATSGIGRVTATALASSGAHVILTGRRDAQMQAALDEIRVEVPDASLTWYLADYSDLDQVRDMAVRIGDDYSHLDVLVNNAGAFFNKRIPTEYEVEKTFLVNHLAPFLLTIELLPLLYKSSSARIINVSSAAHEYDAMNFADIGFKRGYFGMKAYSRSKLANVLFTYELARRLADTNITVNAVHPGHVATNIWRTNFLLIGPLLSWMMRRVALTPEQGADNTIYLISSPDVVGVTGKYFVEREAARSSDLSYDQTVALRLWEFSLRMTGATDIV